MAIPITDDSTILCADIRAETIARVQSSVASTQRYDETTASAHIHPRGTQHSITSGAAVVWPATEPDMPLLKIKCASKISKR